MCNHSRRPIRLLIVEDQEIMRAGLRLLLGQSKDIVIVGEADTVDSAIQEAKRLTPGVILMDLRLSDGSGVEACREIRRLYAEMRILVLSSFMDDETVLAAMMGGANGYLRKTIRIAELIHAIERVAEGETILDPTISHLALTRMKSSPLGPGLSAQEVKVMTLVAQGKTNKEIAALLGLSDKTVRNYLSSAYQKLNVKSRSQAAALFVRRLPG